MSSSAEPFVFTALFWRLVLIGVGYRLDLNKADATGLIMTAGITLYGKGCRVAAGVDEEVHGAAKDAHGLYNWPAPAQTPELLNPPLQRAPKSPVRSAAVK